MPLATLSTYCLVAASSGSVGESYRYNGPVRLPPDTFSLVSSNEKIV